METEFVTPARAEKQGAKLREADKKKSYVEVLVPMSASTLQGIGSAVSYMYKQVGFTKPVELLKLT
eukprot:UC4_evm6s179